MTQPLLPDSRVHCEEGANEEVSRSSMDSQSQGLSFLQSFGSCFRSFGTEGERSLDTLCSNVPSSFASPLRRQHTNFGMRSHVNNLEQFYLYTLQLRYIFFFVVAFTWFLSISWGTLMEFFLELLAYEKHASILIIFLLPFYLQFVALVAWQMFILVRSTLDDNSLLECRARFIACVHCIRCDHVENSDKIKKSCKKVDHWFTRTVDFLPCLVGCVVAWYSRKVVIHHGRYVSRWQPPVLLVIATMITACCLRQGWCSINFMDFRKWGCVMKCSFYMSLLLGAVGLKESIKYFWGGAAFGGAIWALITSLLCLLASVDFSYFAWGKHYEEVYNFILGKFRAVEVQPGLAFMLAQHDLDREPIAVNMLDHAASQTAFFSKKFLTWVCVGLTSWLCWFTGVFTYWDWPPNSLISCSCIVLTWMAFSFWCMFERLALRHHCGVLIMSIFKLCPIVSKWTPDEDAIEDTVLARKFPSELAFEFTCSYLCAFVFIAYVLITARSDVPSHAVKVLCIALTVAGALMGVTFTYAVPKTTRGPTFFVVGAVYLITTMAFLYSGTQHMQAKLTLHMGIRQAMWVNHSVPLQHQSVSDAYPISHMRWGGSTNLSVIDLAILASYAYAENETTLEFLVTRSFDKAASFSDATVVHADDFSTIPRLIAVHLKSKDDAKGTVVIAVKGTSTSREAIVDTAFYSEIAIMQAMGIFTSVLDQLPNELIAFLLRALRLPTFERVVNSIFEKAIGITRKLKNDARYSECSFIFTGHSLGGGIAEVLAARLHSYGVVFSAPGAHFNRWGFRTTEQEFYRNVVGVAPGGDIVPKVDRHDDMVQYIECRDNVSQPRDAKTCHSITTTLCELWRVGGDPRGRNLRPACFNLTGDGSNLTGDGYYKTFAEGKNWAYGNEKLLSPEKWYRVK